LSKAAASKTTKQDIVNRSTTREDFAMKQYRVVFGAYVRMYADYSIHAEDNEAARKLAIEQFKARAHELQWLDPN
jgi:hypothetical protein